ncbi:ABC transporter substrate-binding protein [Haloactinopolyspora alba]|uniref:ABC transporter substrate-binding protein n=1 Tax=Haloactinopolyspora alba TaxID=648780 RepID=UPI0013ED25EC|nr:extracellular solute-binding protein [Haloactinopolyspora alba]
MTLAAAGCTSAPPSTGGDDDSIRYLVQQPEDPAALELLEEHIAEFEKESGISVELEALPMGNMRTVLQTQLRSGDGPDVFSWGSGPGYAGALAEAGLLYDMTAAYDEYDWPIYDFAKERVTFDGRLIGVPGEMETIGLFYNKTMFADLGIDEPKNLADLKAAAETIRDAGTVPIAASDQEGWQGGHLLSMALSSRIGPDGMDSLLNGETPWDSPDVVAALRIWKDFHEAGYLPESPTSISYDSANSMFYAGKAAMLPTGSWLIGGINRNTDFEVGYIPFPAEDGPGMFSAGLGSGPMISAGSTKTEAALEFVDFLVSPAHGRWTIENMGTIPAYPVDTAKADVSPLFAQVIEDTSRLDDSKNPLGYNIDVLTTDVFNQAMWDGVQAVLTGQQNAEQVAQTLETSFQK